MASQCRAVHRRLDCRPTFCRYAKINGLKIVIYSVISVIGLLFRNNRCNGVVNRPTNRHIMLKRLSDKNWGYVR